MKLQVLINQFWDKNILDKTYLKILIFSDKSNNVLVMNNEYDNDNR